MAIPGGKKPCPPQVQSFRQTMWFPAIDDGQTSLPYMSIPTYISETACLLLKSAMPRQGFFPPVYNQRSIYARWDVELLTQLHIEPFGLPDWQSAERRGQEYEFTFSFVSIWHLSLLKGEI